jgi:hypothetical protein
LVCKYCGNEINITSGDGWAQWIHVNTDRSACYAGKGSTIAEPVVEKITLDTALKNGQAQLLNIPNGISLPKDAKERKEYPVGTGVLDYFPNALAEVAHVSYKGNEQHNPGQPLHWDRSKSTDEADAMMRHFVERGKFDSDGLRHSAKMAWRALALLQKELENETKTTVPCYTYPTITKNANKGFYRPSHSPYDLSAKRPS